MTGIVVRATKAQVEEFMESLLWKDIVRELNVWKTGFTQEALAIPDDAADENPSTASVLMHLGSISGRMKAVDYVLGIPELFLSILNEKEDKENE